MLSYTKPRQKISLLEKNVAEVQAYVLFDNNDDQGWFLRLFTRDLFRHCKIAIRHRIDDEFEQYVLLNGTLGVLETQMVYSKEQLFSFDATIVEVSMKVDSKPMFTPWASCTELVKRVLCIRELMTITPYQLYVSLLNRHNGKLIKRGS